MPQPSHDIRLQESLEKLNFIVARRNELLRELFCMMQSKEDFATALHNSGQEDPNLQVFLQRFDLSINSNDRSITNLKENEIWFLDDKPRQPSLPSPSANVPISAESKPSTSTRTTRSRSRATGLAKSPSPILDKSRGDVSERRSSLKSEEHQTVQSPPRSCSSLDSIENIRIPTEDSDEDNDELDLIGSSAFHMEGERRLPRGNIGVSPVSPPSAVGEGENLKARTTHSRSPSTRVPNGNPSRETSLEGEGELLPRQPIEEATTVELVILPSNGQSLEQPRLVDVEMEDDDASSEHLNDRPSIVEEPDSTAFERLPQHGVSAKGERPVSMDLEADNPIDQEVSPEIPFASVKQEDAPSYPGVVGLAYIRIPLPPSIQEEILIPAPTTTTEETLYNLDLDLTSEHEALKSPTSSIDNRHCFDPQYTIPSLNLLPADFSRKAKPMKRKKEKEREKDNKRDKDDAVPLGLNRWNAILTANPVWRKVSRASKCLNTREWGVAMTELRLIRTIQRIDQLKEDGRWSFRQLKKQRGVGGLLKTHWDYLLDEMKWMRLDFREERRWKMALAYNLSTAVLEWHFAQTPEERRRAGICMKWQSSHFRTNEDDTPQSTNVDSTEQEQANAQLLGITYSSDDEDDQEKDPRSIIDALEPAAIIKDALDAVNDIQPKNEEVDDQAAIDLLHQARDEADRIETPPIGLAANAHPENGLKTSSNDPLLGGSKSSSQSTNGDAEVPDPLMPPAKPTKSALAPFRERIVYSEDDELFVDFDVITNKDSTLKAESFDSSDLRTLFPELQLLGLLDVPAAAGPTDGKKRVEKRSDRDDPNKRIEDTTYTKLYPTGRFMSAKPTLIGPLQPSKRWKDGKWLPMEQVPVTPETETNSRISEESTSELFDGRSNTLNFSFQLHASSFKDKESKGDSRAHSWTATDDALLKSLVDKYSANWPLVSECFNSSRLSTLTDRRSASDCLQRWKERWGSERKVAPLEAAQTSGDTLSASANASQMTTRGVKRLASSSISSPITIGAAGNTESRKRRRHLLLQDATRKAGKKRAEAAQKILANQRKPPQIHETHNQFNKLPKLSPAELSRMKAERDLRDSQDVVLARKRQDEQIRLMREQVQRGAAPAVQGQVQQQQSQAQQQQSPQQPQPQAPPQQVQQQQQQLAQQQLAQLQQLQAQQQANQNQRQNAPAPVLPNRSARLSATTTANARPVSQQAQLLQQARAMQVPVPMQTVTPSNLPQSLLSQAQTHPSGSAFYGLPPNLTQEQVEIFHAQLLTAQQQQQQPPQQHQPPQQGQPSSNGFGSAPQ